MVSVLTRKSDAAGLSAFRWLVYIIVVWEVWRYFEYGRVDRYYAQPGFHFKYFGFAWLEPLPGDGMRWVFLALAAAAGAAALGFLYRVTAPLVAVLLAYVFLLDQARYLNHFYLITIVAALLAVMPANRCAALDARLGLAKPAATVPAWTYLVLRAQLIIVYLYAGIAKLNPDWLAGQPIGPWLQKREHLTLLGGTVPLGEWISHPSAGVFFAWSGAAIDFAVPVLLLIPKTRWLAVCISFSFHLLNSTIFSIGIFPWFMLAATTIFFNPSWPRRYFRLPQPAELAEPANPGPIARLLKKWGTQLLVAALALHFAVQIALPLRHWLYPGDVAWTEEGHRFAWRMKLRDKGAGGYFLVTDPATGRRWRAEVSDYLTPDQTRPMWSRPDMILQLAHEIARREQATLGRRPEVRVVVRASLNYRDPEFLIDPQTDLAAVERSLRPARWITRPDLPPVSR